MSNATIARYYLARTTGGHGYHPGKLEARIMRHPGRRARLLAALAAIPLNSSRN